MDGLGYDDDRMLNRGEISASHWTEGSWDLEILFEINDTDVKMIQVGRTEGKAAVKRPGHDQCRNV